jgi:hypothetical protein
MFAETQSNRAGQEPKKLNVNDFTIVITQKNVQRGNLEDQDPDMTIKV